jgi:hypothetical protein
MNNIRLRPACGTWKFEVGENRLEEASDIPWIQANEDWPRLINKIHGIDIAVT